MKDKALNIFNFCSLNRDYLASKPVFQINYSDNNFMIITNQEKFNLAIDSFISLKEISGFSQNMLILTLRKVLINCEKTDDTDLEVKVDLFIKYLNEFKLREHQVIKNFYGVSIDNYENPFILDKITVYDLPKHKKYLKSLFKHDKNHAFYENKELIVVESVVKAKDHWKALELANVIFNKFELFLSFLLNEQHKNYSVGILRMNYTPYQCSIISSEYGVLSGEELNNNFASTLNISKLDEYLPEIYEVSYNSLLQLTLSPVTVLDKKISSAIEWIGESYIDINKASSYLKAVIALEALLKSDEKSVITSSIMSGIAEQCAFLNGNTPEECIKIERYVKQIYGERSKIAHTGTSSVSLIALKNVREFVRNTILKLIAFKNRQNLKNLEDFQSILRKKKYQGGGLESLMCADKNGDFNLVN